MDERDKRAGKAAILASAQRDLGLTRALNNASLAGFRTYDSGQRAFERLLSACAGSWPRFMQGVATLLPEHFLRPQQEELDEVIERLAERACPGPGVARADPPGRAVTGSPVIPGSDENTRTPTPAS